MKTLNRFLVVGLCCCVIALLLYVKRKTEGIPPLTASHVLQSFTEACREAELQVTVVEPEFLRLVSSQQSEAGGEQAILNHWLRHQPNLLTFGVVEPSQDALRLLAEAMKIKTPLSHHVVEGDDLRSVSMMFFHKNLTLSRIPFHHVWFRNDDVAGTPLVHLLIFRYRGAYLWHRELLPLADNMDKRNNTPTLPFNVFALSMGQHATIIDRFTTKTLKMGDISLSYPANVSAFVRGYQEGKFLECEYVTAKRMYHGNNSSITQAGEFGQRVIHILNVTTQALGASGLRFWIGSGTLLGWYRQCDVIPYAGDADIEMSIKDYSETLMSTLHKAGLRPIQKLGKISDNLQLSFWDGHVKLDLYFVYEEDDHVWYGAFDMGSFHKFRNKFRKYSLSWADLHGIRVRVPDPPEQYLEDMYGSQWRQPVRSYNWLLGPHNKAYDGKWSDKEQNKVIRILHR